MPKTTEERTTKNRAKENIVSIYFNDAELETRKKLTDEAAQFGFKTISDYIKRLIYSRSSVIVDKNNLFNKEIELIQMKNDTK